MAGSLVSRALTVIVTLGEIPATVSSPAVPLYFSNGSKSIELEGYAVEATVTQAGSFSMAQAEITIHNMRLADMNSVSSYGKPLYYQNDNTVALLAGDAVNGMALAFEGNITDAAIDLSQAPDAIFNITAATGLSSAMKPIVPTSYKGSVDVAKVIKQLASQMNYKFENNGVSSIISNPYLQGTGLDQLQQTVDAAGISYIIENNTIAIWPAQGSRAAAAVPISPDNGLYGYPSYSTFGIQFRTLYNPLLKYGGKVNLQSSMQPACGEWIVYNQAHLLASQIPGGDWFSDVLAARAGQIPVVT